MIIFFEDVNENTTGAQNKALAPPTPSNEAHSNPRMSAFSRMSNFVRQQLTTLFSNESSHDNDEAHTKEKIA